MTAEEDLLYLLRVRVSFPFRVECSNTVNKKYTNSEWSWVLQKNSEWIRDLQESICTFYVPFVWGTFVK